jgi:hypothetical protein
MAHVFKDPPVDPAERFRLAADWVHSAAEDLTRAGNQILGSPAQEGIAALRLQVKQVEEGLRAIHRAMKAAPQ